MNLLIENNILLGFQRENTKHSPRKGEIDLVVPETVTEIGEKAFCHATELRSVRIPGTVRKVGKDAFAHCENLREVLLEDGLEEIDDRAFLGSFFTEWVEDDFTLIGDIAFPNSLKRIGAEAFRGLNCEKVTLPEGLQELEDSAFYHCEALERVVFPGTLKCIGSDPHISLMGELETTWEMVELHEGVFACCPNLREVVIPAGVEKIGYEAFADTQVVPGMLKRFGKER